MTTLQPIEKFFYSVGKTLELFKTSRNTIINIMDCPNYGHVCLMNGQVQSATCDERIYHETLVHPAMAAAKNGSPERVLIIGGGEGCTAREVLRWNSVKYVDMIDWDEDAVRYFAKPFASKLWNTESVWQDSRLHFRFTNAWDLCKEIPVQKYDCIIVDLFDTDSSDEEQCQAWQKLVRCLADWLMPGGAISYFTGMREWSSQPESGTVCQRTAKTLENMGETWRIVDLENSFKVVKQYKTWIPSFGGESTFVLASQTDPILEKLPDSSHLRKPGVWQSYLVWNDLDQTGRAT